MIALDSGAAAYLGYLLSKKNGYSLAACGFLQAGLLEKFSFSNNLSHRSSLKRPLSIVSFIWIIHALLLILTIFSTTTLVTSTYTFDSGSLSCVVYGQEGEPYDRLWPSLNVAMGVGEYVFGTSLGHMRSEESVDVTQLIFAPQLVDTCADKSTLSGGGYQMDIVTSCQCSPSGLQSDLFSFNITNSTAALLSAGVKSLDLGPGMATYFEQINDTLVISHVLTGLNVCGGTNVSYPSLPICKTTFANLKNAIVQMTYMTDGTSASIAAKKIAVRSIGDSANMTWVSQALSNILGGNSTAFPMPPTYPGSVNPLLWWATPNIEVVNSAQLEPGLETMWSIILRSAIMRTFSTRGQHCTQSIISDSKLVLKMSTIGVTIGLIFLGGQILVLLIAILGFMPWIFSTLPIGPAVIFFGDSSSELRLIPHTLMFLQVRARLLLRSRETWTKVKYGPRWIEWSGSARL